MKKIKLFVCAIAIAGITLGCGEDKNKADVAGGSSVDLFSKVIATTPVFSSTTIAPNVTRSIVSKIPIPWGPGHPLYPVYYSLRSFDHATDEGHVDRSNIYKLIYDVQSQLNNILANAPAITPQVIASPFTVLDDESIMYDHAINDTANKLSGAYLNDGDTVKALLSWKWTEAANPNKDEIGIARINYNELTGDILINMVFSVDYTITDNPRDHNLHCIVTGNIISHEFQFKYRIGSQNIVAKGISQGDGNNMLFKYNDSAAILYLVVPVGATEDFFIAGPTTYSDPATLPAEVTAYKTWVVNESTFADADMFTDLSQLTGGTYEIVITP